MKRRVLLIFCLLCSCSLCAKQPVKDLSSPKDTSRTSKSLCLEATPNKMNFYDFKHYLLIRNPITMQQYVYWKKEQQLSPVSIDSDLVRSIYLDFLKDTGEYKDYMAVASKGQFKPKVVWLCPYDDSSVLGYLLTYRSDTTIEGKDTTIEYNQMLSVLEITAHRQARITYVDESLPIKSHYAGGQQFFSYKKYLYIKMSHDIDDILQERGVIKLLARFQKKNNIYRLDRIEPESMSDYLVANKVFTHYNRYYHDNGYVLMSLSNYVLHLDTHEKIPVPVDDSVFRKLRINSKDLTIQYYVNDFKYNTAEKRFYVLYCLNDQFYAGCFKAGATSFEQLIFLFSMDSEFTRHTKDICLGWDGKQIIYGMKGDNCLYYADFKDMQQQERNYKVSVNRD